MDAKPKTLIIEHAQRAGYKLLNQKPVETTTNAYRFEVKLGPNATEKFPVAEEHVYDSTLAVSSLTPDNLLVYLQNKAISDAGRRQLQQVVDLKRQITANDDELRNLQNEANEIVHDQDRIRQNITSLNNVSGQQDQVQTYARQLANQEKQLAGLRDRVSELQKKKTALGASLGTAIERLDF